jgi:hypothetical protein
MSTSLESFLARLYVDEKARRLFLRDRDLAARRYGLSEAECAALIHIDQVGLELAAASFAHKRRARRGGWAARFIARHARR